MICLTTLLACAVLVSAHNWVNGPARTSLTGNVASLTFPVLPASSDEPHVVVRPGQKFQFEWVTGHNMDTYVILLAKKDAAKMNQHTVANLEQFFNDTACPKTAPTGINAVYHYKYNDTSLSFFGVKDKDGILPAPVPNFYQRVVPKTDAAFIPRSASFMKGIKNMPRYTAATAASRNVPVSQFEYKAADVASNRRCYPATPVTKFSWIIGAHKARHVRHQPAEPDVIWVTIPAGTPPGDYIIHWVWRAYSDGVDVKVITAAADVADPFGGDDSVGVAPGTPVPKFKRVDHCRMPNATLAGNTCFKLTAPANGKLLAPQACIDACKAMTLAKCDGVAVVPLENPSTVHPTFSNIINAPLSATGSCSKPAASDPATHLCVPVLQRPTTDVSNSFVVTADTEDPAYYSTCYRRSDLVKREGLPDPALLPEVSAEKSDWKAAERCITCADQDLFANATFSPVWKIAPTCINCDLP